MEIKPEIAERIELLEEKFRNSGQDMGSYLDGLLYDRRRNISNLSPDNRVIF